MTKVLCDFRKCIYNQNGVCTKEVIDLDERVEDIFIGCPDAEWEWGKAQIGIVRCKDCRHAGECHKSVQYTRNEPNTVTIGYSPIEWCSRGEKR